MSTVGSAPWLRDHQKLTRATPNPMDKATVVSILPKHIYEIKPTIQPGEFIIEPGSFDEPSTLVVGPSSWWKELEDGQPSLEIPTSSIQIADSIIKDYCNGILACDMAESMPGLFFVPGMKTVKNLREEYSEELDRARRRQSNWYMQLVMLADQLWAQSNGNPLAISNDMRLAAQELNLKDKEWIKDFTTIVKINCPACGNLINSQYPVCQHCKAVVDKEKFNLLGLKFAS